MRGVAMPRRLAVSVGFGGNAEQNKEVISRIKVAEEVGVEAVFTAETWAGPVLSPAQIAMQTSRSSWGRASRRFRAFAGVLAMTAATLDELPSGGVILGLGTYGDRVIEHGTAEFSKRSSGRRVRGDHQMS